jgi:predicted protein tyrosine phosphatase
MSLPAIALSTLQCVARDAISFQASHVLSILDPGENAPAVGISAENHLVQHFHDVTTGVGQGPAWIEPPMGGHIARIIEFARAAGPEARILVHCHMGVSRSPAAVLIIAAALTGSAEEAEACLQAIDPRAGTEPNARMIQMADRQLRLEGKLVAAVHRLNSRRPEATADQVW